LEIARGELVFLVGRSGAGKSTILRLLTGEVRPSTGSLTLDGRELASLSDAELPAHRRRLGIVFQDAKLLPRFTLAENVAFPLEIDGAEPALIAAEVRRSLAAVGLDRLGDRYPHEVSGGERSRASFARAIVARPTIVLADEPTADLDPFTAYEVAEILSSLNRNGTTLLVATHAMEIVSALGKRVVAIDEGRIMSDGPVRP
jgi:cell division transport system ATP-binding protein